MADIDTSISTFISQLPKVELDVHIEGTLSPSLHWRFTQKNHIPLPSYPSYESLVALYAIMYNHRREMQRDNGLPTFLEAYYGGMEVLRTEEDFYDLAMEYFAKAADMNIRYMDPFFDPQTNTRWGVALAAVMNGLARKDGYWITAHCDVGQKNTYEHIHEVATSCVGGFEGADRIDHGLNTIERPELIQIIKQRGLGLTLCPHACHRQLSTEYVFGSIKRLWDEGVRITIVSDDPTYMHQRWVQENLELVMHYCGFHGRDMIRPQKNGVDISWAAEDVKERIRKELDGMERTLT
ncbi:adenosine deaminase [Armillaria gallica]|uniref:Adenosine deaminase n=1 Tax=Armillaria gallica TaxID=47427 RepID=A0A2H3CRE4_ARMGA|nr:adenosine deaminase [Armillaria gallica]